MSTKGLVTRIGEWLDRKFEADVKWSELQDQESKCSQRHCGLLEALADTKMVIDKEIAVHGKALSDTIKQYASLSKTISELSAALVKMQETSVPDTLEKDLTEIKGRIEKIEMHTGMFIKKGDGKVVAKSPFAM